MKTKLTALIVITSFFINISFLHAGTWTKDTEADSSRNNSESKITNDKTPESSNEGLYAKYWKNSNDIGLSMTGWLSRENKESLIDKKINGILADASIKQEFQWSERNPPRMVFSCGWTEVLYVQNNGNCDNGDLFNNKGMVKAQTHCTFNYDSGPENTIDTYHVSLSVSSENQENKVKRSPEVQLEMRKEDNLIEINWDNKPDKKKSWNASGGNIVSYSAGMDNLNSDNIYVWGAIGSSINLELQNNAKSSLSGIFQELSGFDLEMDGIAPDTQAFHQIPYTMSNFNALKQIRQTWFKATSKSNLSSNSPIKVNMFLNNLFLEFNSQSFDEKLLSESIKRYIDQFAYTFQGENEDQACYYMAWLLAEAAAREPATSEDITNTKVTFDNLIDKLTNLLNENAKQAIGNADSPEIQEELNKNLAKVKGRLLYYYYELSEDPLFPLFKKPIDNDLEAEIVKKFENEKILFNLLNNQIKTEQESEFYKKWLSFYFDRIAERIVFWLVVESNKDIFRNPKYWGGMHYRARSLRNGLWPVEIYLTKIEKI